MKPLKGQSIGCVLAGLFTIAFANGCNTKHTITVEPIYMKLDVNVKLDRELEEAFDYQDRIESEAAAPETAAQSAPVATEPGGAP